MLFFFVVLFLVFGFLGFFYRFFVLKGCFILPYFIFHYSLLCSPYIIHDKSGTKAMPVYVANVNVKLFAYAGLYGSLCRF